ncbi:MAG: copper amine oxidase N-terminal domain-containing protein, partial [Chloroflexi bacterium]|nr:copper amine oxidase N-terminal domain-containing protein [Chloroflexota bacterium]
FIVDYTTGLAAKDKTKSEKAVNDLLAYADDFGAFLNSANPNLPKAAVSDLVKTHIVTLKDVIDAQAAGDYVKAYTATRKAFAHMDLIANALAGAIAKQFPDKFDGNADAGGSKLRSALTLTLSEHSFLVTVATAAAFGARDADFKAAADSLDGNSIDLSKAIGSVYGDAAEKAFLPLWRKHIGFVVDYTAGLAIKDKNKSDKAVNDLLAYADDFGAFLNSANPNLPKAAVSDLVKTHIVTLKDVIDAQAAGDYSKAYTALRKAYAHMAAIADPLSDAIAKQFPDKFK